MGAALAADVQRRLHAARAKTRASADAGAHVATPAAAARRRRPRRADDARAGRALPHPAGRAPRALVTDVEAFTDGACRGNPGPGGWGVVLRAGGRVKELSGGEPATTNNRMELTSRDRGAHGAQASRARSRSTPIPSTFAAASPSGCRRGAREAGVPRTSKPVKNQDLWDGARRGRRAPRGLVALGQGSCGSSRERARRRAREPRPRRDAGGSSMTSDHRRS